MKPSSHDWNIWQMRQNVCVAQAAKIEDCPSACTTELFEKYLYVATPLGPGHCDHVSTTRVLGQYTCRVIYWFPI